MDADEERLLSLFGGMEAGERDDLLISIGRRALSNRPIVPEFPPPSAEELKAGVQNEWVDDQLQRAIPYNPFLDNLGDAIHGVLESAWPEGLDQVVFGSEAFDDHHAKELIEPYREAAESYGFPLPEDFDGTVEEADESLAESFRKFIREWRLRVMKHLTRSD